MSDLREKRVNRMREAVKSIEGIEGVEEAVLDDFAPSTAFSGQLVVSLPSESWKNSDRKYVHEIDENLRSIAQRMLHELRESDLVSYSVVEKPEKVYRYDGKSLGYDQSYYFIEVVP